MRLWRARRRGANGSTGTPAGRSFQLSARASDGLATAGSVLAGLAAIARELLARAAGLWLDLAEVAGELVLTVWETVLLPPLELCLRAVRAAVRLGDRVVTPARALAIVALAAAIAMGASQFSDYRAVEVGAGSYAGLEDAAPAPRMGVETPRSAHGDAVLGIAVAAGFVTALAVWRNRRLARLLFLLGAAVILIALLIDAPKGLREGNVAITYEGAKAILLGGFWVQLSAAVALALAGPLLAAQPEAERARRPHRRRRRRQVAAGAVPASAGEPSGRGVAT
jgi:hypothetical protein